MFVFRTPSTWKRIRLDRTLKLLLEIIKQTQAFAERIRQISMEKTGEKLLRGFLKVCKAFNCVKKVSKFLENV